MLLNNIAFDLDGVIANFSAPFRLWAKVTYGLEFISGPQFHWNTIPKITGKMFSRIIAEFIKLESGNRLDLMKIPVLPEGYDLIHYVYKRTADPIYFVTARDLSTAGATHDWISRKFPAVDFSLSVVPSGSSKHRYLDRYDCFVDDRRKTAIDLAKRGKTVFMPMREYNPLPERSRYSTIRLIWPTERKMYPEVLKEAGGKIILLEDTRELVDGVFDSFLFKPS